MTKQTSGIEEQSHLLTTKSEVGNGDFPKLICSFTNKVEEDRKRKQEEEEAHALNGALVLHA